MISDSVPEDRAASPYTGWTRAHWEDLADAQLAAVRGYATRRHALVDLPGPASRSGRQSDGLEGFARTFLLAGFRLAQSGDIDPGGHAEWYAEGLAAGTDPDSPERWPRLAECDQAKVECASVAIALHESRPWIWDRLGDDERQRIVAWMTDMHGTAVPDNNWVWFRAVTSAFLRSVGAPWSGNDIDHAIARTEQWYAGDGWYSDGGGSDPGGGDEAGLRDFDYYSGWAMQYYPLWYCRISGTAADPALLNRYRGRLHRYLDDAQHLVGAGGEPLLQGRSLTYRYAMLCPFWVGAVFDATPLPAGRTRRLASGVLRYFTEAGCFDERGVQPPGWLVRGTTSDGVVRVVNHGSDHAAGAAADADDPCYARLAYATHAFPDSTAAALSDPVDSHVTLLDGAGRPSHRRPLTRLHLGDNVAASRHRAHWPLGPVPAPYARDPAPAYRLGPWITTASVLHGPLEVRLTRVDGPVEEPLRLRQGGYCLAADEPPSADTSRLPAAWLRRPDGLVSTVVNLRGFDQCGIVTAQDANALGRHSATPWLATSACVRPGAVYGALVCLSGAVTGPDAAAGVRLSVRRERSGAAVATVAWGDGTHDTTRLDPPR